MIQALEAMIDKQGTIHLLQPIHVQNNQRVLVTILDERPVMPVAETALLSEAALAKDWNRPEEDEAWSHLQPA
jgi:hypothetical protein